MVLKVELPTGTVVTMMEQPNILVKDLIEKAVIQAQSVPAESAKYYVLMLPGKGTKKHQRKNKNTLKNKTNKTHSLFGKNLSLVLTLA
jgi:Asp/Glu/hydantoin racemase